MTRSGSRATWSVTDVADTSMVCDARVNKHVSTCMFECCECVGLCRIAERLEWWVTYLLLRDHRGETITPFGQRVCQYGSIAG